MHHFRVAPAKTTAAPDKLTLSRRPAGSNEFAGAQAALIALQRTAGNRAVAGIIGAPQRVPLQRDTLDGGVPAGAPATVDQTGAPTQEGSRPVGPGPGVRAAGDVSVSAGQTMTAEATLREVYSKGARQISETARDMIKSGTNAEEAARWAVGARNELKVAIRQQGSAIVRGLAEARNLRRYGNKIGPSYDELIREGKTPEDIIGKSGRASTKVNRIAQAVRVGGWVLIAIDIAIVTWEVHEAEEGDRLRTAVAGAAGIGGALAGGWLGMKAGAWIGGGIGAFFGGAGAAPGAAIGAAIGGVAGAIGGGLLARTGAEAAYDAIEQALDTPNIEGQMLEIDAVEDAYIRAG